MTIGGAGSIDGRSLRRILAWLLAPVILIGCASRPEFALSPETTATTAGRVTLFDENENVVIATDDRPVAAGEIDPFADSDGDGRRDYIILALSGGGAFGAYTAGILEGWKDAGKRPHFDVVTGVSTGALAGALAFVGDDYDPVLERVYTHVDRADLFRIRPLAGALSSSVANDKPLKKLIADIVDDKFAADIAREHARGRRFYVATTNLDFGRTIVWDVGEIASSNDPKKVEKIRQILLASASVPVFFPPVFIEGDREDNGAMHVDGGVKAPILVRTFMLETARKERARRHLDLKVYAVVNGKIRLTADHGPVNPNLSSIAASSIRSLFDTVTYKTLYQVYVSVRRARGDFRLTYVPDEIELSGTAMSFERDDMRKLFDLGYQRGRDGSAWHDEPPRLEPLERI